MWVGLGGCGGGGSVMSWRWQVGFCLFSSVYFFALRYFYSKLCLLSKSMNSKGSGKRGAIPLLRNNKFRFLYEVAIAAYFRTFHSCFW